MAKKQLGVVDPVWPVWYLPEAVLGSAVRYTASLSVNANWVGIFICKGKKFLLGPSLESVEGQNPMAGLSWKSELAFSIQAQHGGTLGRILVKSYSDNAFTAKEVEAIRRVAEDLGQFWPKVT